MNRHDEERQDEFGDVDVRICFANGRHGKALLCLTEMDEHVAL